MYKDFKEGAKRILVATDLVRGGGCWGGVGVDFAAPGLISPPQPTVCLPPSPPPFPPAASQVGRGIDIERVNIVINYDMPETGAPCCCALLHHMMQGCCCDLRLMCWAVGRCMPHRPLPASSRVPPTALHPPVPAAAGPPDAAHLDPMPASGMIICLQTRSTATAPTPTCTAWAGRGALAPRAWPSPLWPRPPTRRCSTR